MIFQDNEAGLNIVIFIIKFNNWACAEEGLTEAYNNSGFTCMRVISNEFNFFTDKFIKFIFHRHNITKKRKIATFERPQPGISWGVAVKAIWF